MPTALHLTALASVACSQFTDLDTITLDFAPPESAKAPLNSDRIS